VAGIKMNIVDIKHIEHHNKGSIPTLKVDKKDRKKQKEKEKQMTITEKMRNMPHAPAVVGGMSSIAHETFH